MKLFYDKEPIKENKNLFDQLQVPGVEFAHILYNKISPIEKNVDIAYFEGEMEDGSKKKLFVLNQPTMIGECYIGANGVFSMSSFLIRHLEEIHDVKNIVIKKSSMQECEDKINPVIYAKADQTLKDFYVVDVNKTVEDKLNNKYRLVIVGNADMTIGEHLCVDELMLYDGDTKIGYLKAKYTTPELMTLHGVETEKFFLNQATIDYSSLKDEYKNKGLGYVMYFHMSQYLQKKGVEFRQSTLCSKKAQLLWNGINKHWSEHIEIRKIKSGSQEVNVSFLSIGQDCVFSFQNNKPTINNKLK